MSKERSAAIDIGSNSILLTIVEKGEPLKVLFDEAYVVGLARGLGHEGIIAEESLERAYKTLHICKDLIDGYHVKNLKVVGTEAFRKAKNGEEVKKKIEAELETSVEIISGEREAELSFWGVQKEFKDKESNKIVFDIGGASTELCLGSKNGVKDRFSLKVGSVLLSEKFDLIHPQTDKKALSDAIEFAEQIIRESGWDSKQEGAVGIGVAGTITNLFSIELKMAVYNRDEVQGKTITVERMRHWLTEVSSKEIGERRLITGMHPDRADVFPGGLVIAIALADYFGWDKIYCMDSGVRYGLLYEMLGL